MTEHFTAEGFIRANADGASSTEIDRIVDKLLTLSGQGELKGVNTWTAVPFIAMGGDEGEYRKYYRQRHGFDPAEKWSDWEETLGKLKKIQSEHFRD